MTAKSLDAPPVGAVVLHSYAKSRRQYLAAASSLWVGAAGMEAVIWFLFGDALLPSNPVLLIVLFFLAGFPLLFIGFLAYRAGHRVVDIEIGPGTLRLPLLRARERGGWRRVDEILFVGIDANPPAVAEAERLVTSLWSGYARIANLQTVRFWTTTRALLVITNDETLFLMGKREVFDALIAHWVVERSRFVAAPPARAVG